MEYNDFIGNYLNREEKASLCVDLVWYAWDKQLEGNYEEGLTIKATKAQMKIYQRWLRFYGSRETTYLGYDIVIIKRRRNNAKIR